MPEGYLRFADENELAKEVRRLLGVKDYEMVRICTPQFERNDGREIWYYPKTVEEFDNLKTTPDDILIDMGAQNFDEDIWVFPKEWYDYIPEGYEVVDIFGRAKPFQKGITDDDIRFGALAFGFKK